MSRRKQLAFWSGEFGAAYAPRRVARIHLESPLQVFTELYFLALVLIGYAQICGNSGKSVCRAEFASGKLAKQLTHQLRRGVTSRDLLRHSNAMPNAARVETYSAITDGSGIDTAVPGVLIA
jgi:hypothetical protein